jgi:membrane protein
MNQPDPKKTSKSKIKTALPKQALPTHLNLPSNIKDAFETPRHLYSKQRYNTPLFVAHEMLKAFSRHNVLSMSASLSFYAMFALIPLVLLMFFILSHWVFSSDYAIVKLAIITGNLVPKFSKDIMVEVYSVSRQQAAWGAAGLFVLFWAVTPLAAAMRSCFYHISALIEAPSFVKRKIKDIFAVLGMLFLFFLFTFAGMVLEKVIHFVGHYQTWLHFSIVSTISSLIITTGLISFFYYAFFPVKLNLKHIFIGALFTAILWLLMRPAFSLFLSMNESYGSMFGGLKNLFISITWLYFNFIVFLLGTELIAILRKQDVLMIKGLFEEFQPNSHANKLKSLQLSESYLNKLKQRYGKTLHQNDFLYHAGDRVPCMFYIVQGEVKLYKNQQVILTVQAGDYLGEMALFSQQPAIADAVITSEVAEVLMINQENLETLLLDEPAVAMKFLREMAARFQQQHQTN